ALQGFILGENGALGSLVGADAGDHVDHFRDGVDVRALQNALAHPDGASSEIPQPAGRGQSRPFSANRTDRTHNAEPAQRRAAAAVPAGGLPPPSAIGSARDWMEAICR